MLFAQIRNYSECACVQSRQVITPSSGGPVSNQLQLVIVKTYLNENGYAVSGKCNRTCGTLIPFLIFLFIVTLITACAQPSAIIVTLRYCKNCYVFNWGKKYLFFIWKKKLTNVNVSSFVLPSQAMHEQNKLDSLLTTYYPVCTPPLQNTYSIIYLYIFFFDDQVCYTSRCEQLAC